MALSLATTNNRNRHGNNNNDTDTTSEFDGVWLNIGIITKNSETGEEEFVRLPRGVAVSDLQPSKIYANMSQEFAATVRMGNLMIEEIQKQARLLEEGESINTDVLSVQLYRRQEEVDPSEMNDENTKLNLFGTSE